jgi:His-Xaa-Ser system radical SAM maturase HxsC
MIPLRGRSTDYNIDAPLGQQAWKITEASSRDGNRLLSARGSDGMAPISLLGSSSNAPLGVRSIRLPTELDYLDVGDIVWPSPTGDRIEVIWRAKARPNHLLLTERCDNYCLMCSQPPRDVEDSWLLRRAHEVVSMLPHAPAEVILTGGEPTLYGQGLLDLLTHCRDDVPELDVHLLTNGRRFSDWSFVQAYASAVGPTVMAGIPLYGSEFSRHDYVVQARGAFDETVRGILHLAELGQLIEIRVVVHQQTAPVIVDIAKFIARNLPFVDKVALMGLELMGLARANLKDVWIDPYDYIDELAEAALLLDAAGITTQIYNHQLCLLRLDVHRFAVRSISDWKNEYLPICEPCGRREECGGFFHSAKYRVSEHLRPLAVHGSKPVIEPEPRAEHGRAFTERATAVELRRRSTSVPIPPANGR